jgi:hypothetical protein
MYDEMREKGVSWYLPNKDLGVKTEEGGKMDYSKQNRKVAEMGRR